MMRGAVIKIFLVVVLCFVQPLTNGLLTSNEHRFSISRRIDAHQHHPAHTSEQKERRIAMVGDLFSRDKAIIDLRSDACVKPTRGIRKAMSKANPDRGDDTSVSKLETKCASIVGLEAGLFIPSLTMANLISLMAWSPQRGGEYIVGDCSKFYQESAAGPAMYAGLYPRVVRTNADGSLSIDEVAQVVRPAIRPPLEPPIRVVVAEAHPTSRTTWLDPITALARDDMESEEGPPLRVHLDGEQLWRAAAAAALELSDDDGAPPPGEPDEDTGRLERALRRLASGADSVALCPGAGAGAPAGAVLCGPRPFLERARRARAALGGDLGAAGASALAAAGLEAMGRLAAQGGRELREDAQRAAQLAADLARALPALRTAAAGNAAAVRVDPAYGVPAAELAARLAGKGVLVARGPGPADLRLATHFDVGNEEVRRVVKAFQSIYEKYGAAEPAVTMQSQTGGTGQENPAAPSATDAVGEVKEPRAASSPADGSPSAVDFVETEPGTSSSPTVQPRSAPSQWQQQIVDDEMDFYEMPWTRPRLAMDDEEEGVVDVSSGEASDEEKEEGEGAVSALTPLQNITAREYEEILLYGAATSAEGFTTVFTNVNGTRALRFVVTPSDPMSAGLDISDPESPEAMTVLQLMQGIDVGIYLPPDGLVRAVGAGEGRGGGSGGGKASEGPGGAAACLQDGPLQLPFVLMTEVGEGGGGSGRPFRAKLAVTSEMASLCECAALGGTGADGATGEQCFAFHDLTAQQRRAFLLEKETAVPFEAIALALRHGARVYAKSSALGPGSSASFPAAQIPQRYPGLVRAKVSNGGGSGAEAGAQTGAGGAAGAGAGEAVEAVVAKESQPAPAAQNNAAAPLPSGGAGEGDPAAAAAGGGGGAGVGTEGRFSPGAEVARLRRRLAETAAAGDLEKAQVLRRQLEIYEAKASEDAEEALP